MRGREVSQDRMSCAGTEVDGQLAMAVLDFSAEGCQADPLGHFFALIATVDRPMDVNQTAAAREERVDKGRTLLGPVSVVIEDDHVRVFELVSVWELPNSVDFRLRRLRQQPGPY